MSWCGLIDTLLLVRVKLGEDCRATLSQKVTKIQGSAPEVHELSQQCE